MRYSKQREAVLDVLKGTVSHPTAEWIYARVRERIADVSLGTVYRNLRELSESGEIETLETLDRSTHYDADTSAHQHFVCRSCARVFDFFLDSPVPPDIPGAGFEVESEKRLFYGLCPDCRKFN